MVKRHSLAEHEMLITGLRCHYVPHATPSMSSQQKQCILLSNSSLSQATASRVQPYSRCLSVTRKQHAN